MTDPLAIPDEIRYRQNMNYAGRRQVPAALDSRRTAVIITAGQSNSINSIPGAAAVANPVDINNYDIWTGNCYQARADLLGTPNQGATGAWANYATVLGENLIAAGNFRRVILVPFAQGASSLSQWVPNSTEPPNLRWAPLIQCAGARMQAAGYLSGGCTVYVLWNQGEADSRLATKRAVYKDQLTKIIDYFDACGLLVWPQNFFISHTSFNTHASAGSQAVIRAAQNDVLAADQRTFPGADTDLLLGPTYRDPGSDLVHFNMSGRPFLARLWTTRIQLHISLFGSA